MATTDIHQCSANGKEALDFNLSKVFAMICSKVCTDRIAVRSLLAAKLFIRSRFALCR